MTSGLVSPSCQLGLADLISVDPTACGEFNHTFSEEGIPPLSSFSSTVLIRGRKTSSMGRNPEGAQLPSNVSTMLRCELTRSLHRLFPFVRTVDLTRNLLEPRELIGTQFMLPSQIQHDPARVRAVPVARLIIGSDHSCNSTV